MSLAEVIVSECPILKLKFHQEILTLLASVLLSLIAISYKVINSSRPSQPKTISVSVVESIEYASNINSSYISLVESINDENDEETIVNPNFDSVPKVNSPVTKLEEHEKIIGSNNTEITYQTISNDTKF